MANKSIKAYTLIAHNGIAGAIMMTSVNTEAARDKILSKGGIIFEDYKSADDAEYHANYAPKDGFVVFAGKFIDAIHDGGKIFAPTEGLVEHLKKKSISFTVQAQA